MPFKSRKKRADAMVKVGVPVASQDQGEGEGEGAGERHESNWQAGQGWAAIKSYTCELASGSG